MGFIRTLARAAILWGQENALDVLSAVVLPCTNSAVTRMLGRTPSRWITRNLWNVRTVDGAILGAWHLFNQVLNTLSQKGCQKSVRAFSPSRTNRILLMVSAESSRPDMAREPRLF